MRWWRVVFGLFIVMGVLIAVVSLYQVSLLGTMDKMGLTGADFTAGVSREKLTQLGLQTRSSWECGLLKRMMGVGEYWLARDSERGELAYPLGEMRILCGTEIMRNGQVEEGTYEVTKGLGYLTMCYREVIERKNRDLRICEKIDEVQVDGVMEGLLESTTGRVYELLYAEWGKVKGLQKQAKEVCLDE